MKQTISVVGTSPAKTRSATEQASRRTSSRPRLEPSCRPFARQRCWQLGGSDCRLSPGQGTQSETEDPDKFLGRRPPFPPAGTPDEFELALAAEIVDAIEQGILVVFSAGNGQFSIEPQVPGVLAAGGVFLDSAGSLRASDYASGFASPWFRGVTVPTVSGLVGMRPRAQYDAACSTKL